MRCFLLLIFFCLTLSARDIPSLSGPVIDEVGILSFSQKTQLSNVLKNVYSDSGIQLQVFIAKDMDGDVIENFSIRATDKWKLGSKSEDKGLLFVMAMAEKKVRIEVGQGLEGDITDAQAGMLIQSLTPYFKRGDFATGILVGVNGLLGLAKVESQATSLGMKKSTKKNSLGGFLLFVIILSMIIDFFLGLRKRIIPSRGGFRRQRSYTSLDNDFGSSGGSSSWSGGGGGFSGGGASGGW
ncbi:MAG: hypothetical protein COW01_04670 [Bdellovibrionales bacterium CG12_big_fil_rev_8_21_14_0_65_38_15]|nr:MAG: hypothetical protein COW79_11990 [Bdellovibrionales bacterium CG22_combo_CG10-13_8_21_14_all_38_13]PIQ56351.1 MAG: hypothetical protein COW01_04670 [Bdellovibrionales bacterium CG12_big_fil_rev_8_21_14_0_65_38_15]PIR29382.1 MAG: hypothetical protein COV38_11605 [Bdellovibrionales bacterium CG11_big_fil_rev_8_21_14_0_20_38_13]